MSQWIDKVVIMLIVSVAWSVFSLFLLVGVEGSLSWTAIGLLFIYLYANIMLWKTVFSERVFPLELMFWLFHTNFLLLPAIYQSTHHAFYWSLYDSYEDTSLLYSVFIIYIGVLSFSLGLWFGQRVTRSGSGVGEINKGYNSIIGSTWLSQALIMLIIAGLLVVIYHQGSDFFMSSRMSKLGQVESLMQMGLYLDLPRAAALGVLLFSVTFLFQRWKITRKLSVNWLLIIFLALGVNTVINYPLSVARFWIFGFLLALMWSTAPPKKVIWKALFVVVFSVMQFTVFPLYSVITRNKGDVELNVYSIRQYLQHGDFDGFQSVVNIMLYIQDSGFEFGRNIISVIFFFIPRAFWDKAQPLGVAAADHMGYEFTNLSAPVYGEFYADFGLISLIVLMGSVGYGVRRLDLRYSYLVRYNLFGINTLVIATLAGYMIILLRGSLLGVVPSIVTLLGMLLISNWIAQYRGKWSRVRM